MGEMMDAGDRFEPQTEVRESMDVSNKAMGCSPLKYTSSRDKKGYWKRKIKDLHHATQTKAARLADVPTDELLSSSSDNCQTCEEWEELLKLLKEKCKVASKKEKIKILTLLPATWSIRKVAKEFSVTTHMVRKAKTVREQQGILGEPHVNKGKPLSAEVRERVMKFYQMDEYSRICPGKKDYVSVKINDKREQMQKRLLLVNVKELYTQYKAQYQDKIGFSKFCELRPKWCLPVNSAGMHSVCVCQSHQNAKLMVNAVPTQDDYKHLLKEMVCNLESRECMLHLCDSCPGKDGLQNYLMTVFTNNDMDMDDMITYMQWVYTDRTTLVSLQQPLQEFLQAVCQAFDQLRHHFVMKSQASYLRMLKEGLTPNIAVILLDFAENYSFIVQDAVQGHHWDNSQATVHPFAVYYKNGDQLKCDSLAVISDCLKHDTTAVHTFISKVLPRLQESIPDLKKVIYFSDGAASQYKNYKNLVNLSYHESDFGVKAEWHFFATSHGKSPCDGIGGTVKRLVARASLQATDNNHILTPHQMYEWANGNIENVKFLYVSTEDIRLHETELELEKRYTSAKTVTGTRSHHSYIPIANGKLEMRRISEDVTFSIVSVRNSDETVETSATPGHEISEDFSCYQPGQYVACVYDANWYVANIIERSDEHNDVYCHFMKRSNMTLSWPAENRQNPPCWIPFQDIICRINAPEIQGRSARHYKLVPADVERIQMLLPNFTHKV